MTPCFHVALDIVCEAANNRPVEVKVIRASLQALQNFLRYISFIGNSEYLAVSGSPR